jgi:hypothetical protein
MKKRLFLTTLLLLALGAMNSQVTHTGCCGKDKEQKSQVEKPTLATRIKDRMQKVVNAIKEKLTDEKTEEQTSTACVCENEACLNCENTETSQSEQKRKRREARKSQVNETTAQSEEKETDEEQEIVAVSQDEQTQSQKMTPARKIRRSTVRGDCCKGCGCESVGNVITDIEQLISSENITLAEVEEETETILNEVNEVVAVVEAIEHPKNRSRR